MIGLIKDHESKILPIQIRRINLVDQFHCFLKVISSKPVDEGILSMKGRKRRVEKTEIEITIIHHQGRCWAWNQ